MRNSLENVNGDDEEEGDGDSAGGGKMLSCENATFPHTHNKNNSIILFNDAFITTGQHVLLGYKRPRRTCTMRHKGRKNFIVGKLLWHFFLFFPYLYSR